MLSFFQHQNDIGETALDIALGRGHFDCAKLLLEFGSTIHDVKVSKIWIPCALCCDMCVYRQSDWKMCHSLGVAGMAGLPFATPQAYLLAQA